MTTLSETLGLWSNSFVIYQGNYNLTHDAMLLRDQQPLRSGDDHVLTFTLLDATTEDPVDITGWSLDFIVKENISDATELLDIAAVIVNAAEGIFSVTIDSTDLDRATQIYGTYVIRKTVPTKSTILYGNISFLPSFQ